MKTANELALEYWDKPPIERVNNTLQDYVYDYMSSQNERYKTTCLAQEAEIARLQAGFDELENMAFNLKTDLLRENHVEYDKGWKDCATSFYHEINRITGESK